MPIGTHARRAVLTAVALAGCSRMPASPSPAPAPAGVAVRSTSPLDGSTQMVLVVTPGWDSTSGVLRRYEREAPGGAWREIGGVVPIVVGRTGIAWDDRAGAAQAGEPVKREGDGRSP